MINCNLATKYYIYIHIYVSTFPPVCVRARMHTHIRMCEDVYTYIHICVYMYIHIYTYTHMCIYVRRCVVCEGVCVYMCVYVLANQAQTVQITGLSSLVFTFPSVWLPKPFQTGSIFLSTTKPLYCFRS